MPLSIQSLQKRYEQTINKCGGIDVLFKIIQRKLCTEYDKNPAKLTVSVFCDSPLSLLNTPRTQTTVIVGQLPSNGVSPVEFRSDSDNNVYPFTTPNDNSVPVPSRAMSPATFWFNRSTSSIRSIASQRSVNNKELVLPILWSDFTALKFREGDFKRALTTYYKHNVHTIIRYLSGTGQWGDINLNSNSSFEAHKLRLVIFYLAAHDQLFNLNFVDLEPMNYFMNKLLIIAREGNQVNSQDDLQGDKPNFDEITFLDTCLAELTVSALSDKAYESEKLPAEIKASGLDILGHAYTYVLNRIKPRTGSVESFIEFDENNSLSEDTMRTAVRKVRENLDEDGLSSYDIENLDQIISNSLNHIERKRMESINEVDEQLDAETYWRKPKPQLPSSGELLNNEYTFKLFDKKRSNKVVALAAESSSLMRNLDAT